MKRVSNLPASTVLPTYVATLFFGAFRAVAVDILWIQLRKVKEEKRWYEMKEVTEFISYVQPRNPEVWSHLGWDAAYNVANGFTDKEEGWKWVKYGPAVAPQGDQHPAQRARTSSTSWPTRSGTRSRGGTASSTSTCSSASRTTPSCRRRSRPTAPEGRPSPHAVRDGDPVAGMGPRGPHGTGVPDHPDGLILYPETMDGFARYCMVLQGMYDWQSDRHEKAKEWFRRARKQVEDMIARTPEAPKKPGSRRSTRTACRPSSRTG
jgi:hypothetical protein